MLQLISSEGAQPVLRLVPHHACLEEFACPRANGIWGRLTPQYHSGQVRSPFGRVAVVRSCPSLRPAARTAAHFDPLTLA